MNKEVNNLIKLYKWLAKLSILFGISGICMYFFLTPVWYSLASGVFGITVGMMLLYDGVKYE